MATKKLEGKSAIITGAARGIGATTAQLFAAEGAVLTLCDIEPAGLELVAAGINAEGGKAVAVQCDVANEEQVKALVAKALEAHGRIDILINNAGITKDALTPRMSVDAWDAVLDTNLKGTFLCSKYALAKMETGGKVVNTASISSLGNIGQANYSASKMGVIGLTHTMALEYARKNICVNAIAPGAVDTPMLAEIPEKMREAMIAKIPLGKPLPPIDIAKAHLGLASDDAHFLTGQTLFVDGGMSVGF